MVKGGIITDSSTGWYCNYSTNDNFLLRDLISSRILTQMKIAENLTNHFLIAMPALKDSLFTKSVVYLYEHSEKGAMGAVINKSLQITLGNLLQHLDIEVKDESIFALPVLTGGPIGPEKGFIIHDQVKKEDAIRQVAISASKEMLDEIAQGKGPEHFIITLGYSGWEAGQLEKELNNNDWLVAPFNKDIIFSTPLDKRWQAAAKTIGVDVNHLSDQIGHA